MSCLVLIRADAGPSIGGGHVVRSCVLGTALREAGATVTFAASAETFAMMPWLATTGFHLLTLACPAEEEARFLAQRLPEIDLTIVDHYQRGANFEQEARAFSRLVMVIEDLPNRPHSCDILLDQTLGRQPVEYQNCLAGPTACLLGPGFALLRPQFAQLRDRALARPRLGVRRLLIMTGATDPLGTGPWALKALSRSQTNLEVDWVTSVSTKPPENLGRLQVRVLHNVSDMANLMTEADLALGCAGSASWERCCLGLPSLLFVIAENQRQICQTLELHGAAVNLGDFTQASSTRFLEAIALFQRHPETLNKMSQTAAGVCDGQGCSRVFSALTELGLKF